MREDRTMTKITRTEAPQQGRALVVMPFGTKPINSEGALFNFDLLWSDVLSPVIESVGMAPERLDSIYGPQGLLDLIQVAIQRAEVVIADFTTKSTNVAAEFMLALAYGKRLLVITQDEQCIPTDFRGLNRYIRYSPDAFEMRKFERELALHIEALRQQPAEEMDLVPLVNYATTAAPATVVAAQAEFVCVRTDTGTLGVLSREDVDWGRLIPDMTRRFRIGAVLNGRFVIDHNRQAARYTLLDYTQGNPWANIQARLQVGSEITGTVRRVRDGVGVFVAVHGAVNGLIPMNTIRDRVPEVGDEVGAIITRLNPEERRITLRLRSESANRVVSPQADPGVRRTRVPSTRLPEVGMRADGEVVRVDPAEAGRGGFLLVRLPDMPRPAMLLLKDMSEDLSADFRNGQVDEGELIYVEVTMVDHAKAKVLLRDLPEPADRASEAAAA